MAVTAKFAAYDEDGKRVGGGTIHLPEYLDWMPIEVKAEYIRFIGQGPERTKFLLLYCQGQEWMIQGFVLGAIDHKTFKERNDNAENHLRQWAAERGLQRRNSSQ